MSEFNWNYLKELVREALQEEMGGTRVEIAPRFKNGTLIIQPADKSLKPKEVPMDVFWKKITSVREKLRVLEQKLNNSKGLSHEERAEFQQYITRCYGSLTTFNVLFKYDEDKFEGMSGADD
jgi:hypothetical protein